MMTAYSLKELVKEALEGGAFDIIYKSLDMDKLITMLNGITKGKEKGNFKKPKTGDE